MFEIVGVTTPNPTSGVRCEDQDETADNAGKN